MISSMLQLQNLVQNEQAAGLIFIIFPAEPFIFFEWDCQQASIYYFSLLFSGRTLMSTLKLSSERTSIDYLTEIVCNLVLKQVWPMSLNQRLQFESQIISIQSTPLNMLEPQEATPSVYFNFDSSNQKTNQFCNDKDFIPYEYSFSTNKQAESYRKKQFDCVFQTPPSYMRNKICKNLLEVSDKLIITRQQEHKRKIQNLSVKLNTQQFFDQFDKNFVVNFGETQNKIEHGADFRKTFQSCPGVPTIKDSICSKIDSHISQPLVRRLSIQPPEQQNEQQIAIQSPHLIHKQSQESQVGHNINNLADLQKENKVPNCVSVKSKLNCEIRKRVLLKNNQRLSHEVHKRKNRKNNKIINQDNLMIITTSNWKNWTDLPIHRKGTGQANSQPIKRCEKSIKKVESNVFTTRFMLKQTLRSTTLDSWRKKFSILKGEYDLKHKNRPQNIFQKPFSLIR